jgi:hypothetical protein
MTLIRYAEWSWFRSCRTGIRDVVEGVQVGVTFQDLACKT